MKELDALRLYTQKTTYRAISCKLGFCLRVVDIARKSARGKVHGYSSALYDTACPACPGSMCRVRGTTRLTLLTSRVAMGARLAIAAVLVLRTTPPGYSIDCVQILVQGCIQGQIFHDARGLINFNANHASFLGCFSPKVNCSRVLSLIRGLAVVSGAAAGPTPGSTVRVQAAQQPYL